MARVVRIGGTGSRGAALVELVLILPLLVLIMVGTTDFARVFYTANVLTNMVRAGAQYCGRDSTNSALAVCNGTGHPQIMQDIWEANPLSGTPTYGTSRLCQCVNDSGVVGATVACSFTTCSTHLMIHVTATATKTFSTFANIPGIPTSLTISRSATMRAQ